MAVLPENRAAQGRCKHAGLVRAGGGGEPVMNHGNNTRKVAEGFLQLFPLPRSSLPTAPRPHPGNNVCVEGLRFPGLGGGGGGCLCF